MSYSFQHSGASLPITIPLGEEHASAPCPACERADADGVVEVWARADVDAGTTTATCSRGHMVIVQWRRGAEGPPSTT